MERLLTRLTPLERIGYLLYQQTSRLGVAKVSKPEAEIVDKILARLFRFPSVREIIAGTDPHYEEGSCLIFSPHAPPKVV